MNNKAHLRPKDFDSNGDIIPMACKEEKGDLISREALKKAVYAEFGNSNLTDAFNAIIDSAPTVADRTEEVLSLQNTIAKLVEGIAENGRSQGEWIVTAEDNDGVHRICCPFCSYEKGSNNTDPIIVTFTDFPNFCEKCGADMRKG